MTPIDSRDYIPVYDVSKMSAPELCNYLRGILKGMKLPCWLQCEHSSHLIDASTAPYVARGLLIASELDEATDVDDSE